MESEKKTKPVAAASLGVSVIILLSVVAGIILRLLFHQPTPSVVQESQSERSESIRRAYQSSDDNFLDINASSDPETIRVAEEFFRELGDAFQNRDRAQIQKLVSAEAMFNLIIQKGYLKIRSPLQRFSLLTNFRKGLSEGLVNFSQSIAFDRVDLLRVEEIGEGELIAYVRFWDDDLQAYQKMRWWLMKEKNETWVTYDYEDLDMSLRTSTLMGVLFGDGAKNVNSPWFSSFQSVTKFFQVEDSVEVLDAVYDMESEVDNLLLYDLPFEIESFARIMKTSSLIANWEFEDGLNQLEILTEIQSRIPPIAHFQRGVCLSGLENWDDAIKSFNHYVEILGWDSDTREMVSDAYYGKGDLNRAAEHAEAGLQDNPDSWGCLMSFSIAVEPERWDEIRAYAANTSDEEWAYELIIDYALEEEKMDLAKRVFNFLRNAFPESYLIEYYPDVFEEFSQEV